MDSLEPRLLFAGTPIPFEVSSPQGARVYSAGVNDQLENSAAVDQFDVELLSGQKLTARVLPAHGGPLQAKLTILDNAGNVVVVPTVTAPAAGEAAIIQRADLPAGTYTIRVEAENAAGGAYTLNAYLNSVVEAEPPGAAINDTPGTSVNLSGQTSPMQGNGRIAAASGLADGYVPGVGNRRDLYRLDLQEGEAFSALLSLPYGGGGQFQGSTIYESTSGVRTVGIGDFNEDGLLDIVVGGDGQSSGTERLQVLVNDGDGGFATVNWGGGSSIYDLAVGDFNHDGDLDVATLGEWNFDSYYGPDGIGAQSRLTIFYGDGSGAAEFSHDHFVDSAYTLTTGDVNNDGRDDLAIGHFPYIDWENPPDGFVGAVSLWMSDSFGNLGHHRRVDTHGMQRIYDIQLFDINNDGFDDIVTGEGNADADEGRIGLYVMDPAHPGDYILSDQSVDGMEEPMIRVTAGRSTANNQTQVIGLELYSSWASAWALDAGGNGIGGVGWQPQNGNFDVRAGLALADVDRDGYLDLLTSSGDLFGSRVTLNLNSRDGFFFGMRTEYEASAAAGPFALADFGADGDLDLVTAAGENGDEFGSVHVNAGRGEASIQLLNAAGNTILFPLGGGWHANQSIIDFIAPATGAYYVQVTGDLGQPYQVALSGAGQLGLDPQIVDNRPQQLTAAKQIAGRILWADEVDRYQLSLKAGDVVSLTAVARTLGPGDSLNTLTPVLSLLHPNGSVAATDQNSGSSNSASIVNFTAPADGLYSVTVAGQNNYGDYDVLVSGQTGALPPFTLRSDWPSMPGDGETVPYRPWVRVNFSHPVLASSVQAGDLLINGQPALGIAEIGGDFVTFRTTGDNNATNFPDDGTYTMTIAPGAITSSLGVPIEPVSFQFTVDANGPRVTASNITKDQTFAPGSRVWSVAFSEELRTFIFGSGFGQLILDTGDVPTVNLSTGQSAPVSQFHFTEFGPSEEHDPVAMDIIWNNLGEGLYEARLRSGLDAFSSQGLEGGFAGKALDGEFNGSAFPSGDGWPGGDFVVRFAVDTSGVTALTPLSARSPVGSIVHELAVTRAFHETGDVDSFSIDLDANQQITLMLVPTGNPGVEAKVDLRDPSGALLASATGAAGQPVLISDINGTSGGTYQIDAASLNGLAGYTLRVIVNAAGENESIGIPNNSRASAQSLAFRTLAQGSAGVRAAVVGDATGSDDYFRFDLTAGQAASVALSGINGAGVSFVLQDSAGNLITRGAGGQANADLTAIDYIAPANGTYYVIVSGSGAYNLLVTRGATFERETGVEPPQDLSLNKQVLGHLRGGAPFAGAIEVLQISPPNASGAGSLDRLIDQLNDDTLYNFSASRTTIANADSIEELAPYDVVILSELSTTHFTPGLANALKRYVELGGAVIVTGSTSQLFGASTMGAFAPLLPYSTSAGVNTVGGSLAAAGTHPITTLVSPISYPVAVYTPLSVLSGATVVARNGNSPTVVVRENIGFGGRVMHLGPNYGDQFSSSATLRTGDADRLLEQAVAWAAQAGDQVDTYSLALQAGNAIVLTTSTPTGETAQPVNLLDPVLELYDPSGNLVASSDNGPDGRNSRITYTATVTGAYRVVVRAGDTDGGAYTLQVTGATGSALIVAPKVVATTPESAPNASAPSTIDIVLSESILASSVHASDLTIVGGSVTGVQLVDGRTVRFSVSVSDIDGVVSYSVPDGAFTDLQGDLSEAFASTYSVDKLGPYVVSSNPASQASSPFTMWSFTFSEDIQIPQFYNYSDFFDITGPSGAVQSFQVRNVSVSGNTFNIEFYGLTSAGTYTIALKPGSIRDLRGNQMDQDRDGINGEAMQDRFNSAITLASPNLVVDSVEVLDTPVFGSPVTVRWTVRNAGTDPAADGWQDRVYLSSDDAIDGNDLILLTIGSPTVPLAPGQSYTRTQSINLPLNAQVTPGSYRFIVRTDRSSTQQESNENDNTTASTATGVALPALPDLVATQVEVIEPATPASGGLATVRWKLTNSGTAAISGVIRDRISLSADAVAGSDLALAEFDYAVNLAAGGSVVRTAQVTVPINQYGTKHFVVHTDAYDSVFEHTNEPNNFGVSAPVTITLSPVPDLVVSNITAPASPSSGTTQPISWTLTNNGTATFSGTIQENIYLSADDVVGGDDHFTTVTFTGTIAPGQSIVRTESIDIPINYSGPRRVVIITDAANQVFEDVGDANNAAIDDAVTNILVPPTPDLIVSSITAPANESSGRSMPVSWTITNNGTAPMTGSFHETVYLSPDGAIGNDQPFNTFTFTGTIGVGETVTRTQTLNIPNVYAGTYKLVVVADSSNHVFENAAEGNNAAIDDESVTISQSPFPNLQVSAVTIPTTALSEEQIEIEWTVTNTGGASTNALQWMDRVFLSADPTFDSTDVTLATLANVSYLGAGESYRQTATLNLPRGLQGDYYVFVTTDVNNQVFEHVPFQDAENDNRTRSSGAFGITLAPSPDLQVTNVVAPLVAFSGAVTEIAWTVTNNGTGGARASESVWTDQVYLSKDQTFNASDTFLGFFDRAGGLAAGASYNAKGQVRLPVGISGDYYCIVVTDTADRVYEHAFESNNAGAETGVTEVLLSPPADLRVTSLNAPATSGAGRNLAIAYTVANEGSQTTPTPSWDDHFYLSPTPTIDPTTLVYLGTRGHYGELAPGQNYSATFNATVPLNLEGDYYVFMQTDANNRVFEINNDNNIVGMVTPVNISKKFADLQATSLIPPTTAEAGSFAPFTWSVINNGTGDTITNLWRDRIVISADNVYGNGDDIGLGLIQRSELLAPGASYTRTEALAIPIWVSEGTYNVFLAVDGQQDVHETDEANNVNTFSPGTITIARNTPDLQVKNVTAPATAGGGQTIAVSFTVQNLGAAGTNANAWIDSIFLSQDTTIGSGDIKLRDLQHTNALPAGGSYTVNTSVTLPDLSGDYYLVVRTDAGNAVVESGLENNNDAAAASAVAISLQPLPDLTVDSVTAPLDAYAGQSTEVSWTVKNAGAAIGEGFWYDTVYLSQDTTLDRTDAALGSFRHDAPLGAAGSYDQTQTVSLPPGLSGQFFFIVSTDNSNRVFERSNELNNTAHNAGGTTLRLLPPADLVAGTMVLPVNGTPGQSATIEYEIANGGTEPALGKWTDAVYLSADRTWDINDKLFGRYNKAGPVAGGASYTGTVTAALPGVTPGEYYVIIRSDILNQIAESSEKNNLSASLEGVSLSVPTLTLDTPSTGAIAQGQGVYYRVDVPAGETLLIDFDAASTGGSTQLFVKHGDVPTRSSFDFAYDRALSPDQQVVVPTTQAGTYYILAFGDSLPSPTNYSIEARILQFEVIDTDYGVGGNGGNLTLQVNGAKFDRTIVPTLVSSGGGERAAERVFFTSSNRLYATFNLKGLNPAQYDLKLTKSSGQTVIVPDGLQVVPAEPASNSPVIFSPPATSAGARFQFTVTWGNDGINDVPAPYLLVTANRPIGTSPDFIDKPGFRFVGTAQDDGPAGILRPDQTSQREFYAFNGPRGGFTELLADRLDEGRRDTAFDYETLRPLLQSGDFSDAEFDAAFAQMVADIGPTWGDLADALAEGATLTPAATQSLIDTTPTANLRVFLDRAFAKLSTSLTGRLAAPDIEVAISGQTVLAHNVTTGELFSTDTLTDGTFIFRKLSAGSYTLSTDAGMAVSGTSVTIAAGQHATGVVIGVERGASATGTVRRLGDNAVVEGAVVRLIGESGQSYNTRTAADGTYFITGIAPGTYAVIADAEGLARGSETNVDIPDDGRRTQNFSLAPESKIIGNIVSQVGPNTPIKVSARPLGVAGSSLVFEGSVVGSRLEIGRLPAGQYELNVSRQGYVPVSMTVTVASGQTLSVGDITLTRGAQVSGTFTSSDPKLAPAGKVLGLIRGNAEQPAPDNIVATASVADDGTFTFENVPAGVFNIRVMHQSAFIQAPQVTVSAGAPISGVSIVAMPGGTISGTVTDAATGQPIAGTAVTVNSGDEVRSVVTDASGTYEVVALPTGTYTVTASGARTSAEVVSLSGVAVDADLTITIAGAITGRVTDAVGEPVLSTVRLEQGGVVVGTAPVNSNGEYLFRIAVAGTYDLSVVSASGAFQQVAGVQVSGGATQTVDFTAGTSHLNLTVADAGGVDVAGSTVHLYQVVGTRRIEVGTGFADANGALTLPNLRPGNYEVVANNNRNRGATVTLTLAQGANAATITLAAQGTITGVVTGAGGAPLFKAGVTLASADGKTARVLVTDAQGSYTALNLPAGAYTVSAVADGYQPFTLAGVTIGTGGSATVDASLVVGTSIVTGRAVDAAGAPLAGGQVTITSDDGHRVYGTAVIGADGTFTVRGAVGGDAVVTISAFGASATRTLGELVNGANVVLGDIALAVKSHAGTVAATGATASARVQTLVEATPVPDHAVTFASIGTALWDAAFSDVRNFGRSPYHVNASQVDPLDKCGECKGARAFALYNINLQENIYRLANEAATQYDEAIVQSRLHFVEEVAYVAGTLATVIVAAEAVLAYFTAGTGISATISGSQVLGITVGSNVTANSYLAATYTAAQVVSGLKSLWELINAAPGTFRTLVDNLRAGANIVNGVGQLLGSLIEVIQTSTVAIEDVAQARLLQGGGGAMNLLGVILSIDQFIEKVTFVESIAWGDIAHQSEQNFQNMKSHYSRYVAKASGALENYRNCLAAASEVCNGTHENPFEKPNFKRLVAVFAASDPNDILGPAGYGPQKFVPASIPLDYTIRFENEPSATAPAQVVTITQTLDSDLDARTFRLGDFGFGGEFFDVPTGSSFYQTRLDLREAHGVYLDVVAGVDVVNRQAFWRFISIDPATGDVPTNPLLGFLPINTTSPQGEGFVQYTIRPVEGSPSGTVIDAQATIVFDKEAPIDTPAIFNTLDSVAPASLVDPLPATSAQDFLVFWRGDDDQAGSAIATFDVYVSRNGSEYELWLDNTDLRQGTFTGQMGSTYAFYAVAVDNAGNIQPVPAEAQAVTTVASTNSAPTLNLDTLPGSLSEGGTFTRAGSAGDVDVGDTLTAEVDYGTGAGFVALTLAEDGSFSLSNVYAQNGVYTVTVRVTDALSATAEQQIEVTVNNLAPVIVAIDDVVLPWDGSGGSFAFAGSFVDAGTLDTFSAQIDYGTGTGFVPLSLGTDGTFALSHRYTTPGDYTVTVRVSDGDGGTAEEQLTVRLLPPVPNVASIQINDGHVQRSMVKSLVVTFDYAVTTFPGSAVSIARRTIDGPLFVTAAFTATKTDTAGKVWTISWSGDGLEGGSLADGVYDVTIDTTRVTDPFGQAGTVAATSMFHRLFGDSDGDRDADAVDQTRMRGSLNRPANYLWYFDAESDGDVDNADFAAARLRLNVKLFA